MILFKIAGLPVVHPEPDTPEYDVVLTLLEEYAHAFLKVGSVSLRDWAKLGPLERVALVRAAERERLFRLALTDPDRAAEEMAPLDGGESRRRLLLHRAVRSAVEGVKYG
jgi:hypothetical protein